MKKTKKMLLTVLVMFCSFQMVSANFKIPLGEIDVLTKAYDLPNTSDFKLKNGNFMDLATYHKEFNIAYILPLYITEEPKLVGYDEKTKDFYDIPETELNAILTAQKINKNDVNKIGFYTRYGGKPVALVIMHC